MGCDIHGVWEVRVPDGSWVAFRDINRWQSYEWFGILSGVHGPGPKCNSMPWDPSDLDPDTQVVGGFWHDFCVAGGNELHNHTLVDVYQIKQANAWMRSYEWEDDPQERGDWEKVPHPDDIVPDLWVGYDRETGRPRTIPMGIPLRDVMGLEEGIGAEDSRFLDRIRFLCAYDS